MNLVPDIDAFEERAAIVLSDSGPLRPQYKKLGQQRSAISAFQVQSGRPALRKVSSMVAVFLESGEHLVSALQREILNFGWRSMNR
jgi:hypothetical protein